VVGVGVGSVTGGC